MRRARGARGGAGAAAPHGHLGALVAGLSGTAAPAGLFVSMSMEARMAEERLEIPKSVAAQIAGEGKPAFDSLDALYEAEAADEDLPQAGFSDVFVPGEGPEHAGIMLIGEQPGDQEDLIGHPFVGPAGKVLDASLSQAGIDRNSTFVTNAVKRFKYAPRGKRRMHQTPTAGDIAHYRWWLGAEVRLVDPKVVVALGGSALLALTGERTLTPLRGRIFNWRGRKLLATIHPSFLLRLRDEPQRTQARAQFVRELEMAARAA
ncbi:MAG: UdgX family uracil-DNA binding protein [Sphingobium sp.]|nr:UdgX family uracil-DNA binding protein [Sphingobium sp.]